MGVFFVGFNDVAAGVVYMVVASLGFLAIMTGTSLLSRVLRERLKVDVFNASNETFPQETRRIDTPYSVNLPYRFRGRNGMEEGWINFNMVRGLLVAASSGSGKTWYIVQHIICQHIAKGHAMFVYDFKFDDLSVLAYNYFLRYRSKYTVEPKFYTVFFGDLSRSHRCNPLAPESMTGIEDAAEGARSFLLGLNPEWIPKQGDFWVESSVSFLTALIWYLKRFRNGRYCTLAHVIELSQVPYHKLFSILRCEPEIQAYLNAFLSAYLEKNKETIGNQMVSFKIAMARLSSPSIYYVVSGNDFTLNVNDPRSPKIVTMGNDPQRTDVYGAVISLYVSTLNRLVNRKGRVPCSEVFDEAPTIYNHQLPRVIATGRSNGISVTVCVQTFSQMKASYGPNMAEVLFELPANKIFGQQTGESAKFVSEWIGRVTQDRQTIQSGGRDTIVTQSIVLESAVPVSRIAKLSAGEFVGLAADDPEHPIELKAFHGRIIQDNNALAKEQAGFKPLPVVRNISEEEVRGRFLGIKKEVEDFVDAEVGRMMQVPSLAGLVIADIN